jgi:hypothetical protein
LEGGTLGDRRTLEHPIRPQTVEMQPRAGSFEA